MSIAACNLPRDALLQRYNGRGATYTDCFSTSAPGHVALSGLIEAFYSTWLFRLERAVLSIVLRRRIPDAEVYALASGADGFAAWTVEARDGEQILLCDLAGRTRSWLAVQPDGPQNTRLYFGSAVVAPEGRPLGRAVKALMPVHVLYSRALLALAARRLR